jgi:hypothetical protein
MKFMAEITSPTLEPNAWWSAQYERTVSDEFINKLYTYVQNVIASSQENQDVNKERLQAFYQSVLDDHSFIHDEALSSIGYVPSELLHPGRPYRKYELGESGYACRPILYRDASIRKSVYGSTDTPLTNLQKGVIATHEAYHTLVPAENHYARELFKVCMNLDSLNEKDQRNAKWDTTPAEIMAQMAEIKNYFSMTGDEVFTKDHLEYVTANYAIDTGFTDHFTYGSYAQSGRLTILLTTIKAGDEAAFVQLMNELPV